MNPLDSELSRVNWTTKDIPKLDGKIALVTGANSGLGLCTAKELALKGAHVILACRTINKSEKTKDILKRIIPGAKISCIEMDLSDLVKVSSKADEITDNFAQLDLLINNAGIMHPPKTLSAQGYEIQFAVNHLSHMLLTLKLLPILRKIETSKIITVTSGAQFFGKTGWKNLKAEKYYNKWESYANSKLANIMFALELHHKLNAEINIFFSGSSRHC